jgi:Profilin
MPSPAGIRMGNEKYIFVKFEQDTKSAYLTRYGGGGAVITKLNTGIVIGIWHKDQPMSKGGNQN